MWLLGALQIVDERAPMLVMAGAFGGLLPDVDAVSAKIHYIGGGIMNSFRGISEHRTLFHSVFMSALVGGFVWLTLDRFLPYVSVAIGLGYLSHTVIDGFNYGGVGYLYPFRKKKYHLLPKILRSRVGGLVDNLLFVAGITGLALFFLMYQEAFFVENFPYDSY